MQVHPKDIIIKRPANQLPQVWLSERCLLNNLTGLTKLYLDTAARPRYKKTVAACHRKLTWLPDTGKSWRWAKTDDGFYYAHDNIPDRYAAQLPSRTKLLELEENVSREEQAAPAETFFTEYLNAHYKTFFPQYGNCNKEQQKNLSKAAAAVEAAAAYVKATNEGGKVYETFTSLCGRLSLRYLPKHPRNFRALVQQAIEGNKVTDLIKLPRTGNQNAALHCNDEEIQSWIIAMRKSGRNYTDAHIARKVEWMCKVAEKPIPSERWITSFAQQYTTQWLTAPERFGAKGRGGQAFRPSITLANAPFAGDCWQVDGTRVNFIDFKLNGNNVFLYIVAVRDVHSGDILGYSFDISENRWVVHNALKMAVETTGHLPYELQMDRFPGHNTEEMQTLFAEMENRGTKITITHTATGKAKLERWFSTLQQVFMMGSDFYYGEGVQSRNRFAHRSKEQLLQMKKAANADGWDFDKAVDEACRLVEAYRNTALNTYSRKYHYIEQSPAQLHSASDTPNVKPLEPHQVIYLFGLRTQRKFTGEGLINIDINKYPFSFRCKDVNVVSRYERVTVCYTLDDLSQVHLYEISDKPLKKYLGTADETTVQMYGPDAEWGKLQEQKTIIRNMEEERQRQLSMSMAVGSEYTMLLNGSVAKHEYEAAETNYLVNEMKPTDNDGDLGDYDVRNQY